ncbi:MAG: flagellar hook-basal body complex protein FliE [Armatimonadetes bacterium]|nr:flagellar hook-basal body complex protein FliE [Armatimonadota bacterium]
MALNVPGLGPFAPAPDPSPSPETESSVPSFAEVLGNALGEVDALQKRGQAMQQAYATGEVQEIHQVMMALEEASLAMQLTLQVRNKVVDAVQEIMRMQV